MIRLFKKKEIDICISDYQKRTLDCIIGFFASEIINSDGETLLSYIFDKSVLNKKDADMIYLELLNAIEQGILIYDEINKYPVQKLTKPIYCNKQEVTLLSYSNVLTLKNVLNIKKYLKGKTIQAAAYISFMTSTEPEIIQHMSEKDLIIAIDLVLFHYIV